MKTLGILIITLLITYTNSYANYFGSLYYLDGKPMLIHLNSVPLYYNPSFAGSAGKARLSMNYLNKLYSTKMHPKNYSEPTNYHFSYDQPVERIHAGIGILAYYTDKSDYSYDSIITSGNWDSITQALIYQYMDQNVNQYMYLLSNSFYSGAVYSQKISIDQKITIAPSLKIGYANTRLNPLLLPALLKVLPNLTDKALVKTNVSYLDISAGILINTGRLYAGFAIDHINKPKIPAFISTAAVFQKMPVYIYQTGYTYQKNTDSKFALSCNLLFAKQKSKSNSIINLSCKYKWASVGVSSSSGEAEALSALIGFHTKNFVIGYSKNIFTRYVSYEIGEININAHEISMKYLFDFKKKDAKPDE